MKALHLCRFDSTLHLTGRKRTYESVKAAALEAGRFSVFEASLTRRNAQLFTALEHDPEVETFRNPPGYPWIGIRSRSKGGEAT